jgi:hypothetical protein
LVLFPLHAPEATQVPGMIFELVVHVSIDDPPTGTVGGSAVRITAPTPPGTGVGVGDAAQLQSVSPGHAEFRQIPVTHEFDGAPH